MGNVNHKAWGFQAHLSAGLNLLFSSANSDPTSSVHPDVFSWNFQTLLSALAIDRYKPLLCALNGCLCVLHGPN